jgi:inner membrane protein
LPSQKLLTTPAPFQNLFWFVISGNDSGFYTGYRSVFDEDSMQWKFSPRNEHLLAAYANRPDIRRLKRFSNGFYTVNYRKDSLQFNDLRFGQIIGWQDSREEFAFHYYVQYPEENHLVVQRGRFDKLGQIKLTEYLSRIFGN